METVNITRGKDLGVMRTTSISLGQAKKPNSQGKLSRIIFLTAKKSALSESVNIPVFEEDFGTAGYEELMACRKLDSNNQPLLDQNGGFIVDMNLVIQGCKARRAEMATNKLFDDDPVYDPLFIDTLLRLDGACRLPYTFPDGPRIRNDRDGKVQMRDGKPDVATSCDVFVQIEYVKPDGTFKYVEGWELERRGRRMMNTFFKQRADQSVASVPQQAQPEGQAPVTQLPPVQPTQQQGGQPVQQQGQGVVIPQAPVGPGF